MQTIRFISTLALAAAAVSGYAAYRRKQGGRDIDLPSKGDPLRRWEDEGGSVPVSDHRTAGQVVIGDP